MIVLISLSGSSLLVYRSATNICMLNLYPVTLLNILIPTEIFCELNMGLYILFKVHSCVFIMILATVNVNLILYFLIDCFLQRNIYTLNINVAPVYLLNYICLHDTFEIFGYAIILCADLKFTFFFSILCSYFIFLFVLSSFSCSMLDNCSKNEHSLYIFYLNKSTSSTC